MAKLSKRQQEVVDLMREGWALCLLSAMTNSAWLQKNGCGKDGEAKRLNLNTFYALLDKGLIKIKHDGYPTRCYQLRGDDD